MRGAALLGLLLAAAPVAAQDRTAELIAEERALVRAPAPTPGCAAADPFSNEIVVCARDRSTRFRVPSSTDADPESDLARDVGDLRPPNVSGLPPCSGVCAGFGRVPPPIYYFDITALPAPAPGTDADRIAKGEARAP